MPENIALAPAGTLTVLAHPRVACPGDTVDPAGAQAVEAFDALTRAWPTDAHCTAYAPVSIELTDGTVATIRLDHDMIGEAPIVMWYAIGDLDDKAAHAEKRPASDAWRAEVEPRLEDSGLLWYRTRGGARVVGVLAEPIAINTRADAAAWKARHHAWRAELAAKHGLDLDPACGDWTRLFRLPNVQRDGRAERAEVHGGAAPVVALPAAVAPAALAPRVVAGGRRLEPAQIDAAVALLEPHASHGQRHRLALAIGGYFCKAGIDQADAETVVAGLPSENPAARVKDASDAYRQQNPAGASALGALGVDVKALDAATRSPMVAELCARRDARAAGAALQPLILTRRADAGAVYVDHGPDAGGYQPVDLANVPLVLAGLGLADDLGSKRAEAPRAMVNRLGGIFVRSAFDYRARVSRFEPDTATLVVGFHLRPVKACFNAHADRWLRALGGDEYPRLAAWVASCDQRHIGRLAAALVLLGPAGTGKTLVSSVVAGLWGEVPVGASLLNDRFNGDLHRCPILLDDEAVLVGSGALSTKAFRTTMQARERSIEPKGRERSQLRGAVRFLVTGNDVSDLQFRDVGGADVLRAVADRLCVIDCKPRERDCREALAPLVDGDGTADLQALIGHAAWLADTVAVPPGRFIAGGSPGAARAVLAGAVAGEAALWATLLDWLDAAPGQAAGAATAWHAVDGALCVDTRALADALGTVDRRWDLPRVRGAVAPFARGWARPRLGTGYRPRLHRLDPAGVGAALRLDDDQAAELARRIGEQ